MNRHIYKLIWALFLPSLILVTWELTSSLKPNPFFPPPSKIAGAISKVVSMEWIFTSVKSSLIVLFAGYLIGATLGLVFGSLLGEFTKMRVVFLPICNFIRSIPSVAKVSLILSILGLGISTRISTVSIAVLFPVLMSTVRAIAATNTELLDLKRTIRFGRLRGLISIRVPAAIGEILTGLHASVQVAVLSMIVSEMLGSSVGIGAFIIQSQTTFRIVNMWVGVLIVGLIGVTLNFAFMKIERKLAPWYFKSKGII
jgi:ABC-type nitrate/sulfonate/bicarbonate transport system permease component